MEAIWKRLRSGAAATRCLEPRALLTKRPPTSTPYHASESHTRFETPVPLQASIVNARQADPDIRNCLPIRPWRERAATFSSA